MVLEDNLDIHDDACSPDMENLNTPKGSPIGTPFIETNTRKASQTESCFQKTDLMGFLDIVSKLTNDIQALHTLHSLAEKN